VPAVVEATLYTDAGCPWAYSANPALRVLEWRFREQLSWRLVMIGLREEASEAAVRTYDPHRALARWRVFEERYGMPFAAEPKDRPSGTGHGCRAVVAAGLLAPGSEWATFRALQLGNFTGSTYLDDIESIRQTLGAAPGIDADAIADRIDDPDVTAEYERQRAKARSAAGTPAEVQDKTATSDGVVRYTAPSVVFTRGGDSAHAGGWQPLLAYDTVLANFAPELERVPPPDSPEPLFDVFPDGLTTAEVAQLLAHGSDPVPDRAATEAMLTELASAGAVARASKGRGALWSRTPVLAS
jgi:protein-disulfide isomerase-like protein with CxxC motif